MSTILKTVIFLGSSRNITPPWGGPSRLGDGVLEWVKKELSERVSSLGPIQKIKHEITVYDPLEVFGEGGALAKSGADIKTPHFFFGADVPEAMETMRKTIRDADCYLIVTPEYNHTIPPALSGMMSHFGGSNYAFKPSGIITYSIGPYGGTRAAMALRPFLSELGTLPVSKLACFFEAQSLFDSDGSVKDENNRQLKQLDSLLGQLEWYAIACANQRKAAGTL